MGESDDAPRVHNVHGRHRKQVVAASRGFRQIDAEIAVLLQRRIVHAECYAERPGEDHVAIGQELIGQTLLAQGFA